MYYTEQEAAYLMDLYSDYADLLEETTAILAVSANPMICHLAEDVMDDLQEDIEELNLAFAVGGLVPQGSNEPDTEDTMPDMMMNVNAVPNDITAIIEKWQKTLTK